MTTAPVSTTDRFPRTAALGGAALLAAAICAVYAPVLRNGWVWDDATNLVAMRPSWRLSWDGVVWAFTSFVEGHYQPLTWLSYALDERLFGGGPGAVLAGNVALHLANTLLFAVLAWRLLAAAAGGADERPDAASRRLAASLLAAGFFALHPLRVESVAWATERRDVLSAFFALLSCGAHLAAAKAEGRRRRLLLAAVAGAFLLALLSKAQVTLPLGLLVLDAYPLRRMEGPDGRWSAARARGVLLEKAPLFALSALFSVSAFLAQRRSGALVSSDDLGLLARAAQAAYGVVFYTFQTFFGLRFSPLYERPVPLEPAAPRFVLAAIACSLVVAFAALARRRASGFTATLAWQVALLLPVLGFAQSGVQLVADRYSYLSCLGWAVLFGWGVSRALGGRRALRIGAVLAALALLGERAVRSHRQTFVWRNDETLYRHILAEGPSALAASNLGTLLVVRGDDAEGVELLLLSLETVPRYARPWYTLRTLLETPGRVPPARAKRVTERLAASIGHHRASALARYTLALAFLRAGDLSAARAELDEALRLRPGYAPAESERNRLREAR